MGRGIDAGGPPPGGGGAGGARKIPLTGYHADQALDGIRRFYDSLAPDYDLMTSFDARFAKERPGFEAIVKRFGIATALDAGCGTGFHSILLSQIGVAVTGVDASPTMVEIATGNARRLGAEITTLTGSFSEISRIAPGPFDAVFCLGNSLVHLLTDAGLEGALRNFRAVIRPGGILVVQVLNYDRILSGKTELLGKREAGGVTFERRYAYHGETITFTITKSGSGDATGDAGDEVKGLGNGAASVTLRPLTRRPILEALARTGFVGGETFGDLAMSPFDPAGSPDLVIIARKPGPS